MLSKLTVKNFIIIDNIEIDFEPFLNVIIGETGSGKSILIEALLMLFGEKASAEFVRAGTNKAIIEASFFFDKNSEIFRKLNEIEDFGNEISENLSENNDFENSNLNNSKNNFSNSNNFYNSKNNSNENNFRDENDFENENKIENFCEIIIRREIPLKGNSRCFINDAPVTISILKEFSRYIVDFHGQNSQQKILEKENQLKIIDNLIEKNKIINKKNILENYKKSYSEYFEAVKKLNLFLSKSKKNNEKSLEIQNKINEIDAINPQINEDLLIENELKLLENSEYLFTISDKFISLIENDENSVFSNLFEADKILEDFVQIDNSFSQFRKEFYAAIISIKETFEHIKSYKNNVEFNPERIENLRNRYAILRKLTKKYGTVNEILQFRENLEIEQQEIENYNEKVDELGVTVKEKQEKLKNFALILSEERKKIAKIIENKIILELANLGIENALFEIKFSKKIIDEKFENEEILNKNNLNDNNLINSNIFSNFVNKNLFILLENEKIKVNEKGIDTVDFYISTNKGEEMSALKSAVSGGEISRIMLAIKTIMAESDETPLLIFDEIDTGISGKIAQKVGLAMKNLSKYHQILTITHLPQIAAIGENLILVEKSEEENRTVTNSRILDENEKIIEIAKMMSGEIISYASIENAKELIK